MYTIHACALTYMYTMHTFSPEICIHVYQTCYIHIVITGIATGTLVDGMEPIAHLDLAALCRRPLHDARGCAEEIGAGGEEGSIAYWNSCAASTGRGSTVAFHFCVQRNRRLSLAAHALHCHSCIQLTLYSFNSAVAPLWYSSLCVSRGNTLSPFQPKHRYGNASPAYSKHRMNSNK
jgi:hypothetical protein